jgi:hypothetical protein
MGLQLPGRGFDQIKDNAVGGTCNTYAGEDRCVYGFGQETRVKETIWNTWVHITKMYLEDMGGGGVAWIDVAEGKEKQFWNW